MKFFYLLIIILLASCKLNKLVDGKPVGKWKYISGTADEKNVVKGKYNKLSQEKGVWRYYINDTIYRTEKFYYPYSVDRLYHKNGVVAEMGLAITKNNRWTKTGTWYAYNEKGDLLDSITFDH